MLRGSVGQCGWCCELLHGHAKACGGLFLASLCEPCATPEQKELAAGLPFSLQRLLCVLILIGMTGVGVLR
jgi:hypothetical protein